MSFVRGTVWAHEFYVMTHDKVFEQCGYLFQKFLEVNVGTHIYCGATGYVHDWANNREILKYFNQYDFDLDTLQDGDWIIWTPKYDRLPHIAMYRCKTGNEKWIYCLDSNTGTKLATQHNLHVEGARYILRLKEWDKPKKAPQVGDTYVLKIATNGYMNSHDAKYRSNAKCVYKQGTYYIYKIANGMLNITKDKNSSGAWINPLDC